MKIELEYLEKLVKLVKENELSELSLEEGEKAIIIKKEKELVSAQAAPVVHHVAPAVASAPAAAPASAPKAEEASKKGIPVTSPMVGTFYKAPSPGAPVFTEVGKTVSVGHVLCIIEAMKLMNEIESEVAGKVIEICVQDGQQVEYGQTLMIIEP